MWMLDEGPFGFLARNIQDPSRLASGLIHLGETAAASATKDCSGRRRQLLDARSLAGEPVITVHQVRHGTEAWDMLFQHLRPIAANVDVDFGEHESIALCACETHQLTLVVEDARALRLAVSELGPGRVAFSYDLWSDLLHRGIVGAEEHERLCTATRIKNERVPRPWRLARG